MSDIVVILLSIAGVLALIVVFAVIMAALVAVGERVRDFVADRRAVSTYQRIDREEQAAIREIQTIGRDAREQMLRQVGADVIEGTAREVTKW